MCTAEGYGSSSSRPPTQHTIRSGIGGRVSRRSGYMVGVYVGGTGRSRADARRDEAVEAGATHRSHNLVHLGLLVIRGRDEDVVCCGGVGVFAVRLGALVVPPAADYVPDTVRIQER